MGDWYPPPLPGQMLARGDRLLALREYSLARKEFESLIPKLGGAERDQARVRVGAVDYLDGQNAAAYRYLQGLSLSKSEADAERLYYMVECARLMGDDDAMLGAVKALERDYPDSLWRFRGLVTAGRRFLLVNQPERYEPLFEAAAKHFPDEPLAAYCHWKITWYSYLRRSGKAEKRLREHVERFPDEPSASTALYFLGRLAEADKEYGAARVYYEKVDELFPELLLWRPGARAPDPAPPGWRPALCEDSCQAGEIPFPTSRHVPVREASPETRLRIERARLLKTGGFDDWAETELRFGIRKDGQPCLLAMELARFADSPHQRLRYMKSAVPDYLSMALDDAPTAFWELLFPLPYRTDLVRNAKLHNLDPFIVAGLIRQESEFNPQALSAARAYGLTQVRPATGRQIARRAGVRRFSTRSLFHPATNLKLGTYYLRLLLDQWGGKWEETLASYNAGKTRVDDWLSWGSYREPAEFVESIPFTETREYVQAVLRNAAVYRELYEKRQAKATQVAAKPLRKKSVSSRKPAAGRKRATIPKRRSRRR